ncbi:DUF4031 domain-containing protein [Streptosporangium canum]|uniref:DUF4031 domain-containing protein n=1 Tax=Streptosporangium canum TaxID=324952 RepID=UPI00379FAC1F
MTIYVDDAYIPAKVRQHISRWCHLFSDTSDEELHAFAAQLGLRRSYFQKPNGSLQTHRHYDVTEGVRARAVALGAVEITRRAYVELINAERARLRHAKTTHQHTRSCCPSHRDFHRRAMAALHLAVAENLDGARTAVLELPAHHGPGALTGALLVWIDALVSATPDVQRRLAGRDLADDEAVEPVTRWATQMIAARAARDKAGFEALRTAIPKNPAAVGAHVMGLLTLIATYLRTHEMRTS